VDLPDFGYSEPGDGEHLDQTGRDLFAELVQQARVPGRGELGGDLERSRAHALGRGQ